MDSPRDRDLSIRVAGPWHRSPDEGHGRGRPNSRPDNAWKQGTTKPRPSAECTPTPTIRDSTMNGGSCCRASKSADSCMADDVVLNKATSIERCPLHIVEEYGGDRQNLLTNRLPLSSTCSEPASGVSVSPCMSSATVGWVCAGNSRRLHLVTNRRHSPNRPRGAHASDGRAPQRGRARIHPPEPRHRPYDHHQTSGRIPPVLLNHREGLRIGGRYRTSCHSQPRQFNFPISVHDSSVSGFHLLRCGIPAIKTSGDPEWRFLDGPDPYTSATADSREKTSLLFLRSLEE